MGQYIIQQGYVRDFYPVWQLMSFCGQQRVQINTIKNVLWVVWRRINVLNPLLRNAAGLRAVYSMNGRTPRSTPTLRHRRSSRWTYWSLLNSLMGFWSSHYLCVKFVLRLMHCIHALIRGLKPILRGHFVCVWKLGYLDLSLVPLFGDNALPEPIHISLTFVPAKISNHWFRQWLGNEQGGTDHYMKECLIDCWRIHMSLDLDELPFEFDRNSTRGYFCGAFIENTTNLFLHTDTIYI